MSNALPPQKVLSQLEDQKCNKLTLRLATLNSRRDTINREIETADMHLEDAIKQREMLSQDTATAFQFSMLESVRQDELDRKNSLMMELDAISVKEKEVRAEIFICMNKSKAYTKLLKNEEKLQQKRTVRVEQQSVDDQMAHRRTRENQV